MSEFNTTKTSIFKKYVMAITGIALFLFVILHLAGNLSLYKSDGTDFNTYAEHLHQFGWLLYVAEVGLGLIILIHAATGIRIAKANRRARPIGYKMYKSKGGPSHANLSSLYMPVTGALILIFLIIHLWQFRFGPGIEQGYATQLADGQARDLYRLVIETFKNPIFVIFYVFAMVVLGFHLRHGIWSAFQSLGVTQERFHRCTRRASVLLAVLIALAFAGIPLWIYFH